MKPFRLGRVPAALVVLALIIPISSAPARASCSGADPAIVSTTVKNAGSDSNINHYLLSIMVSNKGRMAQPSNVLQFVAIYENGIRLDVKSILPLRPGQSRTVTYGYQRSSDAGSGTSTLNFQLIWRQPSPPGSQDCNPGNDRSTITF